MQAPKSTMQERSAACVKEAVAATRWQQGPDRWWAWTHLGALPGAPQAPSSLLSLGPQTGPRLSADMRGLQRDHFGDRTGDAHSLRRGEPQ